MSPAFELLALMRDLDLKATADVGVGYFTECSTSPARAVPDLLCSARGVSDSLSDCGHVGVPLGCSVSPLQ